MRSLPVLLLLGVGLLNGAGLHSVYEERQCSSEFESLRFVATPQGPRIPLYWDQNLINYLTQAYGDTQQMGSSVAGPVVLPLYSANPMIFRSGSYVFVTTGLLSKIRSEAELLHFFERPLTSAPGKRNGVSLRNCGVLTPESTAFAPVWSHLKESLTRYEAGTHLRLKRRAADVEAAPADSTPPER